MRTRMLIAAGVTVMFAAVACALTYQWSVPAGSTVVSLMADGKGGCAFVYVETNGAMTVVWVDTKGTTKYEKALPLGTSAVVSKCLKKSLVYYSQTLGSGELIQVDKKGSESSTVEPGKVYAPLPMFASTDKKGLFVVAIDTNQLPTRAEIIRYTVK